MPEENRGNAIRREPENEASPQPPNSPANNQTPPPITSNSDGPNKEAEAIGQLDKDVKKGEWWLIGIGIATLFINIGIAKIYYGQLQEMRKATIATRDAVDVASRTLTETQRSNKSQAALTEAARVSSEKASENSLNATVAQFRQDQRAWIAPVNAYMTSEVQVGTPFKFEIQYANVGKQPAFDVRATYTAKPVPKSFIESGKLNTAIEADKPCAGKKVAQSGDVIYPGLAEAPKLRFTLPADWPDADIVSGNKAMIFEMCFTYKTINVVHHTSFCYMYQKGRSEDAHLLICTAGNHAD